MRNKNAKTKPTKKIWSKWSHPSPIEERRKKKRKFQLESNVWDGVWVSIWWSLLLFALTWIFGHEPISKQFHSSYDRIKKTKLVTHILRRKSSFWSFFFCLYICCQIIHILEFYNSVWPYFRLSFVNRFQNWIPEMKICSRFFFGCIIVDPNFCSETNQI